MRKYIGLLIVAIIITFANVSCDKKKKITPIDTDVKKYFSYKPGTYWIYRDSLTGVVDSFAVWRNYATTNVHDQYSVETAETYSYRNNIIDSSSLTYSLHENQIDFAYSRYYSSSYVPLFTYPFLADGSHSGGTGVFTVETLPIYNLHGNSYHNVIKIALGSDVFHVNNEVGVIKFRLNGSRLNVNMELMNSNIIR